MSPVYTGLGREGEYHLDPQFVHGPAELGWHPGEAGAGRVPEDPVPVGVQGEGNAAVLQEALDQQEVAVGVLLLAEEGVDHRAGGIVHCDQQRERWNPVPQATGDDCRPSGSAFPAGAFAGGVLGALAGACAADCSTRR